MALNLVQQRSGPSIWDRQPATPLDGERWVVAMLAGAAIFAGLKRGSGPGLLLVLLGGGLGWWAATGPDTRRARRAHLRQVWPLRRQQEIVDEASEESFPASDSPAWTPTAGNE